MVKLEKRKMSKNLRVSIIDLPVAIDAVSAFARKGIQIFDINVRLIDRKVLSSIYPAMNSSSVLSQLCLIKVNHLFTLSFIPD